MWFFLNLIDLIHWFKKTLVYDTCSFDRSGINLRWCGMVVSASAPESAVYRVSRDQRIIGSTNSYSDWPSLFRIVRTSFCFCCGLKVLVYLQGTCMHHRMGAANRRFGLVQLSSLASFRQVNQSKTCYGLMTSVYTLNNSFQLSAICHIYFLQYSPSKNLLHYQSCHYIFEWGVGERCVWMLPNSSGGPGRLQWGVYDILSLRQLQLP